METDYEPQLPAVVSELIELALNDLELVEEDERYVVNMERWHEPELTGVCAVCLAGAVMASTLNTAPDKASTPHHYCAEDSRRLLALDYVRTANWSALLAATVSLEPVEFSDLRMQLALKYSDDDVRLMGDTLRKSRYLECREVRARLRARLCELGNRPRYATHPAEFKRFMRQVAAILKKEGH